MIGFNEKQGSYRHAAYYLIRMRREFSRNMG